MTTSSDLKASLLTLFGPQQPQTRVLEKTSEAKRPIVTQRPSRKRTAAQASFDPETVFAEISKQCPLEPFLPPKSPAPSPLQVASETLASETLASETLASVSKPVSDPDPAPAPASDPAPTSDPVPEIPPIVSQPEPQPEPAPKRRKTIVAASD